MKTGRNNPCPCGSGLKYKKCCNDKDRLHKYRKKSSNEIGSYIGFRDIFFGEENNRSILHKEIKSFDLDDYLLTTSKINYFLSNHYNLRDQKDIALSKELLSDEAFLKAKKKIENNQSDKLIVHHQMVALIMENLLIKNNESELKVNQNRNDYGKSIFRMNDFLENDLYENTAQQAHDKEKMIGSMFRNMFINDEPIFAHSLGRYYSLFFKYMPKVMKSEAFKKESIDLVSIFEEKAGVSLELYMILTFMIWGHYSKNSIDEKTKFLSNPGNFILNTQLDAFKEKYKENARLAFQNFSNDRMEFSEELKNCLLNEGAKINYYRVEPFYKKPLYRLPNGNYFPLDLLYFQRKITSSLKWDIHDDILNKERSESNLEKRKKLKGKRNRVLAFYGRVLESYVIDLLRFIARKQNNCTLLFNKEDTGGVDFILYDKTNPESIIFIELTASWLHLKNVMDGNIDSIMKQFKETFVKRENVGETDSTNKEHISKTSKEKIKQIHDSIEMFKDGKLRKLNFIREKVKKIYPVLMTEVGFPQFPNLTSRYKEIILSEDLLKDSIDKFQFIDVEELELLEAIIK